MPCRLETWREPARVYFSLCWGLFWRNALWVFFPAAFSPTASIPPRTCKCHGGADDDGWFFLMLQAEQRCRGPPCVSAACQSLLPPLRAGCQQSFDAMNPYSYCFLSATELKALKIHFSIQWAKNRSLSARTLYGSFCWSGWELHLHLPLGGGVSYITAIRDLDPLEMSAEEPRGNVTVIRYVYITYYGGVSSGRETMKLVFHCASML